MKRYVFERDAIGYTDNVDRIDSILNEHFNFNGIIRYSIAMYLWHFVFVPNPNCKFFTEENIISALEFLKQESLKEIEKVNDRIATA